MFTYSKSGRGGIVKSLNLDIMSSFYMPHLVEMSFQNVSICFDLMIVMSMCCENVSLRSKVITRIFWCSVVDSV